MGDVTGNFTLVVNPATPPPPPLTLTPSSGQLTAETVGVNDSGQVVTIVSGGVKPYIYQNVTGVPSGMDLNNVANADGTESIVLSGIPDAGDETSSPYTITFDVLDSATPTAKASFGVPVVKKA